MPRTAPPPRDWKTPNQAAEYAGVSAQRFGPRLLRLDRADLDRLFRPVPAGSDG